jgi:hypothetical protein
MPLWFETLQTFDKPTKAQASLRTPKSCMECGSLLPLWFETLQTFDKPTKAQASLRTPKSCMECGSLLPLSNIFVQFRMRQLYII